MCAYLFYRIIPVINNFRKLIILFLILSITVRYCIKCTKMEYEVYVERTFNQQEEEINSKVGDGKVLKLNLLIIDTINSIYMYTILIGFLIIFIIA